MPKAGVNGYTKAKSTLTSEESLTPQATPRRSKRKLDIEIAEPSPKPSKAAKAEINGNVKATATSPPIKSEYTSTPRSRKKVPVPEEADSPATTPSKKHKSLKDKAKEIVEKFEHKVESIVDGGKPADSPKRKTKTRKNNDLDIDDEEGGLDGIVGEEKGEADEAGEAQKKPKRKRKTKEEKEAEAMPLAARTIGLRHYIGAHVSMAGGVENAIKNSMKIGGNAFALFLKSQRKWENPPLKDENRDLFLSMAKEQNYDQSKFALPHGSYLVNLAIEDNDRAKQAYDAFIDDFHRCESLGIKLYNFHPGAYSQSTLSQGISRIAIQLNRAFSESKSVIAVLENASGSGTVIGSRFSDLRDIIAGIDPAYKSRIGVCIDTCHAFAAGYDLRTPSAFSSVMTDFDKTVGFQYLKALHINDSKAPFDSKKDLHQNIGLGFLGLRAFHNIMNDSRFENIPLILETPCDVPDPADPTGKKTKADASIWATEIKLLESLVGMDAEGKEFKGLEKDLSDKGKAERNRVEEAIRKAGANKAEKKRKEMEKGQRSLKDMFTGAGGKTGKGGKKTGKKGAAGTSSSELSELSDSEGLKDVD